MFFAYVCLVAPPAYILHLLAPPALIITCFRFKRLIVVAFPVLEHICFGCLAHGLLHSCIRAQDVMLLSGLVAFGGMGRCFASYRQGGWGEGVSPRIGSCAQGESIFAFGGWRVAHKEAGEVAPVD